MEKIKEIFVNICDKMKMSYLIIPNLFQSARCLLLTILSFIWSSNSYLVFSFLSVPPRMVQINQNRGHDIVESVNVSCVADYVYPEPTIDIYHGHGTNR